MSKKYDYFQDYLEWEILEPEQEITNLTFEKGLYNLGKECIIKYSRNGHYKIVASISGITSDPVNLEPNIEKIKGTFYPNETITGISRDGLFTYKFYGIVLGDTKYNLISIENQTIGFHADLMIDRIEKTYTRNSSNATIIQEWYLSGKAKVNFPRSTTRSVDRSFKRSRGGIDSTEEFSLIKSSGSGRDYLLVQFQDTSFIVSEVPKEYGPDWSFNLSIEYRESFGRIPNEEEREAISELVSFTFGNHLLKIGQTSYDSNSSLVIQEYQNPWGDNIVSKCQSPAFPPIEIDNYKDWGRVELLINELLPNFIKQREQLKLKDVLWKYWLAKYSTLGTNLPILSSAIETLTDEVISNHPAKKHYYIEYQEFSSLISDELLSFDKKLEGNIHKDKIISKIKGASQRGSNEKLEMMFDIINLPIGEIERKAIKARNKMAHASLGDITDSEIIETIRITRAYETLFHRVFLKILSYKGKYIDYYTLGHPNRNIDEPIPK